MDLNRWNRRARGVLSEAPANLFDFIDDLLEGDGRSGVEALARQTAFSANMDLSTLESLKLTETNPNICLQGLFPLLVPHYEAGFLFNRDGGFWQQAAMFLLGHLFATEKPSPLSRDMHWADPGRDCVLLAPGPPVLKALGLPNLHRLRDTQALLFQPLTDAALILVSDLPHPWLMGHTEKTLEVLRRNVTRIQSPSPTPREAFK